MPITSRPASDPLPRAAEASLATAAGAVAELEGRVARQALLLQALCRLLISKNLMTEEEFRAWTEYIDKADGREDGRLRETRRPLECPRCRRMSPPKSPACQYCGEKYPLDLLDPLPPDSGPPPLPG